MHIRLKRRSIPSTLTLCGVIFRPATLSTTNRRAMSSLLLEAVKNFTGLYKRIVSYVVNRG